MADTQQTTRSVPPTNNTIFLNSTPSTNDFEVAVDSSENGDGKGVSSTATEFGESFRSIFRWRNSFFQLIWKQALLYYAVYIFVTLLYDYAVTSPRDKANFEAVARELSRTTSSMPIVLLLGFFTSSALNRWFSVINTLPGTSRPISAFILSLQNTAPDGAVRIKCYSRYVLLMWLMTFRTVSAPLRRKYPTLLSMQKADLLLEHERLKLEEYIATHSHKSFFKCPASMLLFEWLIILIKDTSKRGYFCVPNDSARNLDQVQALKKGCCGILKFYTKNIPVSLIQAVTCAIHLNGLFSVFAHIVQETGKNASFMSTLLTGYMPIQPAITYLFYYVWLKVGRIATDPFGEDEDDINVVALFESHVQEAEELREIYGVEFESLLK